MINTTPTYTNLTSQEKLETLSHRFYGRVLEVNPWVPAEGDYYTSSRADLELYRVVKVTEDKISTIYCVDHTQVAEWDRKDFLTDGFGLNRVHVPLWLLKAREVN